MSAIRFKLAYRNFIFGLTSILAILLFISISFFSIWALTSVISFLIKETSSEIPIFSKVIVGLLSLFLFSCAFSAVAFLVIPSEIKYDKQIFRNTDPELFKLIDELVEEMGISHPSEVYLVKEGNAAASFHHNFRSIISGSNNILILGIPLISMLNREELKGIIAHEFAHFKQETVASSLPYILAKQLLFGSLASVTISIQKLSLSSKFIKYLVLFSFAPVKLFNIIYFEVLKRLELAKNNLFHQKELHADEIAVSIIGKQTYQQALLKVILTSEITAKIEEKYYILRDLKKKSNNFFDDQYLVLDFMKLKGIVQETEIGFVVLEEKIGELISTKLIIENKYITHPSLQRRLHSIKKSNINSAEIVHPKGITLLTDYQKVGQEMIDYYLKDHDRFDELESDPEIFAVQFRLSSNLIDYDPIFNGYYNHYDIIPFEVPNFLIHRNLDYSNIQDLFSVEKAEMLTQLIVLELDIQKLRFHQSDDSLPNKFIYDGTTYSLYNAPTLLYKLENEYNTLINNLKSNDTEIFLKMCQIEHELFNTVELVESYISYFYVRKKGLEFQLEFQNLMLSIEEDFLGTISNDTLSSDFLESLQLIKTTFEELYSVHTKECVLNNLEIINSKFEQIKTDPNYIIPIYQLNLYLHKLKIESEQTMLKMLTDKKAQILKEAIARNHIPLAQTEESLN